MGGRLGGRCWSRGRGRETHDLEVLYTGLLGVGGRGLIGHVL